MTELELVTLLKEDSSREKAFKDLVKQYQQKLYFHIRRIVIDHDDANDVLQNTFIKIWNNISSFRGESQLYTWLYRIATNESLGFLSQKQKKLSISIDDYQQQLSNQLISDQYFDGNTIQLKLQQAILTLPEKQRLVFNMRYYEEMPYHEMSDVLGTSEGALKASYHIAVKKIEQLLTGKD
jgi:RNA polymerase sigma factor (sigma-70 family)